MAEPSATLTPTRTRNGSDGSKSRDLTRSCDAGTTRDAEPSALLALEMSWRVRLTSASPDLVTLSWRISSGVSTRQLANPAANASSTAEDASGTEDGDEDAEDAPPRLPRERPREASEFEAVG